VPVVSASGVRTDTSRRILPADRVAAIVEVGHDVGLRRDDRPGFCPERLARRDVRTLVSAVIAAAARPSPTSASSQGARPEPAKDPAERTSWYVASAAQPVPAGN